MTLTIRPGRDRPFTLRISTGRPASETRAEEAATSRWPSGKRLGLLLVALPVAIVLAPFVALGVAYSETKLLGSHKKGGGPLK